MGYPTAKFNVAMRTLLFVAVFAFQTFPSRSIHVRSLGQGTLRGSRDRQEPEEEKEVVEEAVAEEKKEARDVKEEAAADKAEEKVEKKEEEADEKEEKAD